MKRFIFLGIVVLMVVFAAVPGYADAGTKSEAKKEVVTPQFTYISMLNPGLSINSFGKATCVGIVTLYDDSHSVDLTVSLQQSSGSGWSTIKAWTVSGQGVPGAETEQYYYVLNGTYRVAATAKVYSANGSLLETQTLYSATVTY